MNSISIRPTVLILACLALGACSGRIAQPIAQECGEALRLADKELEDAKVNGFGGSIQWIKAANLVAGAKIQQQLERYESCVDKARRARLYAEESQK